MGKLRIAVIGCNFGGAFAPIYLNHPDVAEVGICDPDLARLNKVGDEHGISARYSDLAQVLAEPRWDAVHLLTPVPLHAQQTLAAFAAGKHVACAVPMATSLEDLEKIIEASRAAGKNYMMMETGVYTREYLFAEQLLKSGEMGTLTFMKGAYYQDLEGNYPLYWKSQPPMHYATHSLSPLIALAGKEVRKVCCFGSGTIKPSIQQPGGNTFPLQTAIFKLHDSDVAIELTRAWFQTARGTTEAISVYGDLRGFEWQQLEWEDPVLFEMPALTQGQIWREPEAKRVKVPDRPDLLPESIQRYTDGWHGGSHPHLVHEFVRSIVEERESAIGAVRAAQWTAPGICADDSSKQDGDPVLVPSYRQAGVSS